MFSGNTSITTQGIRVDVSTAYLFEKSIPQRGRYVFAYQVRIFNESGNGVQLMRRKWIITDGMGQKRIVEGPGVIGETPLIEPGNSHEYISGCDFPIPFGKMEGFFLMVRPVDGHEFKVRIPAFSMIAPWHLN